VPLGIEPAIRDQRLRRAVVVREIEVEVEGERVRDGEIVRLIAAPGVRAVGQQPRQHQCDDESEAPAECGLSVHAASIRAMPRRFSMTLVDVATRFEPAGVRCHAERADGLSTKATKVRRARREKRRTGNDAARTRQPRCAR
jgi:hypothetical protein